MLALGRPNGVAEVAVVALRSPEASDVIGAVVTAVVVEKEGKQLVLGANVVGKLLGALVVLFSCLRSQCAFPSWRSRYPGQKLLGRRVGALVLRNVGAHRGHLQVVAARWAKGQCAASVLRLMSSPRQAMVHPRRNGRKQMAKGVECPSSDQRQPCFAAPGYVVGGRV